MDENLNMDLNGNGNFPDFDLFSNHMNMETEVEKQVLSESENDANKVFDDQTGEGEESKIDVPSTGTENEENDEEGSSGSEEIEPMLKYSRMANDLENILCKEAASCIAVHPKFLCLGSHWGKIHLLDHLGHSVGNKELKVHTVIVNQISIDDNGDFLASCSYDGKVIIYGLYTTENNVSMEVGRLVKSIAIDPDYYKSSSGRRFITGDERLVLHEKTLFSRLRQTVLYEAEGSVQNIRWKDHFVAWASDIGVRVYDMNARCSLGLIKWNRNLHALPEHYRCNLCWKNSTTLLVGWVDTVRVCVIRKRNPTEMIGHDVPEYIIDPVSTFTTDFFISGIGPFNEYLVLLGYSKEMTEAGKAQRPQLHVVEPKKEEYNEVYTDSLSLRGYPAYSCNDYHLECLIEESTFFIVSPKDVVVAKPYDADDRVQWLMKHSKYETAMEAVMKSDGCDLKRYTLLQVGRAYLDHLLATKKYDEAGKLCQKILGEDKKLWEEEVFKFALIHQLRAVSPYLPQGDHALDPHIYEVVLYEFLKMDPPGFLNLVKKWSPKLYNIPAVVNAVLEHLLNKSVDYISRSDSDRTILLEALAILYSYEMKYDKSLAMYLKLKHKDVFQLIRKHKLFSAIYDMIEGLMALDHEQAINMFLEKNHERDPLPRIPPDVVVAKLEHNQFFLYLYLDAFDKKNVKEASKKYHGRLVKLYADFERGKLLPFLRQTDQYPIEEALNICKERCFYPEMVYLLGRTGSTKDALNLITKELNDIEQAINFCKEHDDIELWEDLINYSLNKPDCITFLLQKIGTYIDPRMLVKKIESGMEIPGLKHSLGKMMRDYNLQVSVQEGCKKILVSDYFNLHERLVRMHHKGIAIEDDQLCGACHRQIIVKDVSHDNNVIIFYCKHTFHEVCVPAQYGVERCMICHSQKRNAGSEYT